MGYFESFIGVNFWTALFTLLNFVVLFLVAKKFLVGPVLKMIQERQKEIDDMYANAEIAEGNAKAMEAEYQQKLSAATETGERLVKEAVIRGQNREEEIVRQANAEAAAIMDKAQANIAQEKKKAINDAKNEISDIAMSIAQKVIGHELTDADRSRMVDEFINELGDEV